MAVISLQLLLQTQDLLVALVQAPREARHDVPLLHQQALVAIHLQHQQSMYTHSLYLTFPFLFPMKQLLTSGLAGELMGVGSDAM